MTMIFCVWLLLVIHMTIVWVIYRLIKNPSVVDVGWATGLMLCGALFVLTHNPNTRSIILLMLLFLWGLRLGLYLFITRISKGHVDKRYLTLSEGWKIAKPLGFFLNFQLQGVLILIIAMPWFFIPLVPRTDMSLFDMILILVILAALIGETVADQQLQQFKRQSPGRVCNTGLWQYSRHPNYFCEWLIWCGFSLLALSNLLSYFALLSPLCLYLLMTKITGPMTETASLKSRGDAYRQYQTDTPMFFPRFNGKP